REWSSDVCSSDLLVITACSWICGLCRVLSRAKFASFLLVRNQFSWFTRSQLREGIISLPRYFLVQSTATTPPKHGRTWWICLLRLAELLLKSLVETIFHWYGRQISCWLMVKTTMTLMSSARSTALAWALLRNWIWASSSGLPLLRFLAWKKTKKPLLLAA